MISSAVVKPAATFSAPLKRNGFIPHAVPSLDFGELRILNTSFFISALSGNIS